MTEWYGEDERIPSPVREASIPITKFFQETVKPRSLSFDEASKCLNTLGKDESGVRYAYLMLTATDRKLTDVSVIPDFKHLLYLDLSGNFLNLTALQVLCELPYLLYLKAERNLVESAAINPMPYLQVLLLNKNQIMETNDIVQPILETLEIGNNSIYTPQFLQDQLAGLKQLSIHGNYLIDTSGSYPRNLEKLYLNQNRIVKITPDICNVKSLEVLSLRDNFIKKLNGFTADLENLTYLNLRNNKIEKMRQFRKLECLPKLDTIIVLQNPIYKEETLGEEEEDVEEEEDEEVAGIGGEEKIIRLALLVLLPFLKRINKANVTDAERYEARERERQIRKEIFEQESSEEEVEVTPTTTDVTTDLTASSVEMKGTPIDSATKFDQFYPAEEDEFETSRSERRVDINLIPEELTGERSEVPSEQLRESSGEPSGGL